MAGTGGAGYDSRAMPTVRRLEPGDEQALLRFLSSRPDTTMFLRSNLSHAGLAYTGEVFSGTYAAAIDGGEVVAVAARYWNGNIVVEAPVWLAEVVKEASAERAVTGLLGPREQVVAARRALGLAATAVRFDSEEILFSLSLDELRVPAMLGNEVVCRRARVEDVDELVRWRAAYTVETFGDSSREGSYDESRERVRKDVGTPRQWVLERDGDRVAMSGFNATTSDCVQIGGGYTPPALRGRGYGRAVVAGSLVEARRTGVQRSILFTDKANLAAQAAYAALGYRVIGDYGIILFPSSKVDDA